MSRPTLAQRYATALRIARAAHDDAVMAASRALDSGDERGYARARADLLWFETRVEFLEKHIGRFTQDEQEGTR